MRNIKTFVVLSIIILVSLSIFVFSEDITQGIVSGLTISCYTLVPSLFPFMCVAGFVSLSGVIERLGFLTRLPMKLLKLPPSAAAVILLGLTGGFPTAAVMCSGLVSTGQLTKKQGSYLVACCTGAGPAFVITGVGVILNVSLNFGLILFFSGILTSLTLLILFRPVLKNEESLPSKSINSKSYSFVDSFVMSVKNAAQNLITVTAFVTLWSAIGAVIIPRLTGGEMFFGFLEVSYGSNIASSLPVTTSLYFTAAFLGFGSLSVICQVMAVLSGSGISISLFIKSRFIAAALYVFYSYTLLKVIPIPIKTFSTTNPTHLNFQMLFPAVSVIIMLMLMLLVLGGNRDDLLNLRWKKL